MSGPGPQSPRRRLWPLAVLPLSLCALGFGILRLDAFSSYREFASSDMVPETLVKSGRTATQLRLLEYTPLDGWRLEGYDSELSPEAMPSTTVLSPADRSSSMPVISVVVDSEDLLHPDTGLFANPDRKGRNWERPAYASYFRDGRVVWASLAGLRVHGGKSRHFDRKSLRLHFRDLYGQPGLQRGAVFDGADGAMQTLVVHNDRRGNWHYVNPMAYEIASRIGCIVPATEPVRFWLNGEYQGAYVLTEHVRADFLEARFGHSDFFLADTKSGRGLSPVRQGSEAEWEELTTWPNRAPAPMTVREVEKRVDLDNLTNWFISVLYTGPTDAFQGFVARDRTKSDGRWFWINWDMDHAFMDNYSQVSHPWEIDNIAGFGGITRVRDSRAVIINRLREESPEYRSIFLSRLTEVLNHELTAEFMESLISRYERAAADAGIEDVSYLDTLRQYVRHRPAVLREQMNAHFSAGPAYRLEVTVPSEASVTVDGHAIAGRYLGWYFADTPARISLEDETGAAKVSWQMNGRRLPPGKESIDINLTSDTRVELVPDPDTGRGRPVR